MRQEIPLQGGAVNAHQTIQVQLGENFLDLTLDYRTVLGQWSLSIEQDGTTLVPSTMLEPSINVIQHHPELREYGKIWFVGSVATLDNLGTANQLVWESPA